MEPCQYPPPIEAGDTVAVLSPSHAPPTALERGCRRLASLGVSVDVYPTATRDSDWLRAHPDERAADIEHAFADDDVAGIVATMGGNAAHQLFSRLDVDVLRANPTRFFGSSDNTHLHSMLTRCGQVSFYGGQLFPDLAADAEIHPYTRRYVERAFEATPFGAFEPASEWTDEYATFEPETTRSWFPSGGWHWHNADDGTASGTLVGGCLSMLRTQSLLATSYCQLDGLDGCVLAIETSGETPCAAAVERFFTALGERGALAAVAGILVGRPETPKGTLADRERYRADQRRVIEAAVDAYAPKTPVVFDLDFGHTAPVLPLPMGALVELDTDARTISAPAARRSRS
ncbi:S66 peptidase family protein [Haloferacaceae archaeon DSL9]